MDSHLADPALHRARLLAILVGMAALVVLSAAMLLRAARYDRLNAGFEAEERATFRRALPGQPIPVDPASRLSSEAKRLQATVGDEGSTPERPAGTSRLTSLLSALPADIRFDVFELRLDGRSLALDGRIRRHEDAEAVADALRSLSGLTVESPATEQLADGIIGFSLAGNWSANPGATPGLPANGGLIP